MDDLKTRLEALRVSSAQQRRATWVSLQAEAPDLAELLTEIRARFGRPEVVRIDIDGKRVWPVN